MKFAACAILATVAFAGRQERMERRERRWNEIEDLLNNAIEQAGDIQDYIKEDLKPEVEDYRMRSTELHDTVADQMQWDTIENWQQFQERLDSADYDVIMEKVKAMDKNNKINWDHVEKRMDQAAQRREEMNAKMQAKKEKAQERKERHMEKAQERKERAEAKIEEINTKVNENIDWDTINTHVDRANAKINAIDWSFISESWEKSADAIKNARWENVVRKDEKDLDWDLLSENFDLVIENINTSIDAMSEQFDKAHEVDSTVVVEVVQPLVDQAELEFEAVPVIGTQN